MGRIERGGDVKSSVFRDRSRAALVMTQEICHVIHLRGYIASYTHLRNVEGMLCHTRDEGTLAGEGILRHAPGGQIFRHARGEGIYYVIPLGREYYGMYLGREYYVKHLWRKYDAIH